MPAERIWVAYIVFLAFLTLAEALTTPEVGGIDGYLDAAILLTAFLGCVAAWVLSARSISRGANQHHPGKRWLRLGIGWFLGPNLGLAIVLGINAALGGDIDGGLLLFYLPVLSVLVPVIFLPFLMLRRNRQGP